MTPFRVKVLFKKHFGLLVEFHKFSDEIIVNIPWVEVTINFNVTAKGFKFGGFHFYE